MSHFFGNKEKFLPKFFHNLTIFKKIRGSFTITYWTFCRIENINFELNYPFFMP
jgi:hypothetical protein